MKTHMQPPTAAGKPSKPSVTSNQRSVAMSPPTLSVPDGWLGRPENYVPVLPPNLVPVPAAPDELTATLGSRQQTAWGMELNWKLWKTTSSKEQWRFNTSTRRLPMIVAGVVLCMFIIFLWKNAEAQASAQPPCILPLSAPPAVSGCLLAGEGSGAGQVSAPEGVAVNQASGDVYIADLGRGDQVNDRVDVFDREDGFVEAFGWGVDHGNPEFEACTSACREGVIGTGSGQFDLPVDVAVDNSAESSHGNVYLTDHAFRVQEFSEAGAFVLMFGTGVNKTAVAEGRVSEENVCPAVGHPKDECGAGERGTGHGQFETGDNPVAVDASGDVWVGDEERLEEFSAAGVLLRELTLPGVGVVESFAVEGTPPLAGDFYVKGSGMAGVRKLDGDGEPAALFPVLDEAGHPSAVGLNPETGDLFVNDELIHQQGTGTLLEFSPEGVELASFAHDQVIGEPTGNALAFGEKAKGLYVASSEGGDGQAAVQAFVAPPPGPLVVGGSLSANPLRITTATLHATVNPEDVETKYHFEYITQAAYEKNVDEKGAADGFEGATGTSVESLPGEFAEDEVSAAVVGLRPETAYRFCLSAGNKEHQTGNATCSSSEDEATFTTLSAAEISEQSASKVTVSSALLQGVIDPLGLQTEYRFEYLTEAEYQANIAGSREPFTGATQAPVPDGSVGSSEEGHPVSENIQGLTASTVYRYRLVAHNHCNALQTGEVCSASGPALAFTTQTVGGELALPDNRQWEMVSPPDKHGALLIPIEEDSVTQASSQGDAIAYVASGPTEANPAGNGRYAQLLSTRGPDGWATKDIAVAHAGATEAAAGGGQDYRWFSEDLSQAAVQPFGVFTQAISPEATEQTAYLRNDATGVYTPLVTRANDPFQPFGEQGEKKEEGPEFLDATPDGAHVVLFSLVPLTDTALPAYGGLYEWSGGHLALVSVLPRNEHGEVPASEPALGIGFAPKNALFPYVSSKRGAISNDGSRVVFTEKRQNRLYLRDVAQGRTIQLDAPEAGCAEPECEGGGGIFQLAIEGGEGRAPKVLFTDEQRLTSDSGAVPPSHNGANTNISDLYQCEIVEGPGGVECRLSDLTPRTAGGESAGVQGLIEGASTDGSYLYFVAGGVLTHKPGPDGESAQPGGDNLYAWHEGAVSLVAVLSGGDTPDWGITGGRTVTTAELTARVSPDGEWLAFMSQRPLTGYDNVDASAQAHGARDEEVFEYDAQTGRTSCVSCDPTGARPVGVEATLEPGKLSDINGVWPQGLWVAANVPGWTPYVGGTALFQSRYLSNEGRLFFNSSDALVPQDVDGTEDVYEYEPEGLGTCSSATAAGVFKPAHRFEVEGRGGEEPAGCVSLISSGSSDEESGFLDASENGSDVFFLTAAKLSKADYDTSLDLYDAHECTTASPCIPEPATQPPECETAESCRAAPQPEPNIYGPPSSATFNGQGNVIPATPAVVKKKTAAEVKAEKLKKALAQCRRDKKKSKRQKCEKTAKKKFGAAPNKPRKK
jgi:hypothetical protein